MISEESIQSPSIYLRDEAYYFEDGNIVFLVQDRLFRVHRSLFERSSTFFRTLFSLPQGDATHEGKSDEAPIACQDTVEDFQALCWAIYASPPEVYAQKNVDTIDIPKLVSVVGISHKYELSTLRDWALDIIDDFSTTYPEKLILRCRKWDRVGRILTLAKMSKREDLAQRIQDDWLRRITANESNAFMNALRTAEACEELRMFHGRVYYTYLKATNIMSTKNTGAIGIGDVGAYKDEAMAKLTDQRRSRLCQGYWSLMLLRPRLMQAPTLEDVPACSVHSSECTSAWQTWWRIILTEAQRSGRNLDDPVEIMGEVQKRLPNSLVKSLGHTSLYGSYVLPPPCDAVIRAQAQQMVDSFFDSLPDRFIVS